MMAVGRPLFEALDSIPMISAIYKYYISSGDALDCFMCQHSYAATAPLSTLKKHLRVKHGYSIRRPPPPEVYERAIRRANLVKFYKYIEAFGFNPPSLGASSRMSVEQLLNP